MKKKEEKRYKMKKDVDVFVLFFQRNLLRKRGKWRDSKAMYELNLFVLLSLPLSLVMEAI